SCRCSGAPRCSRSSSLASASSARSRRDDRCSGNAPAKESRMSDEDENPPRPPRVSDEFDPPPLPTHLRKRPMTPPLGGRAEEPPPLALKISKAIALFVGGTILLAFLVFGVCLLGLAVSSGGRR